MIRWPMSVILAGVDAGSIVITETDPTHRVLTTAFPDTLVRRFLELVISKDRSSSVPGVVLVER